MLFAHGRQTIRKESCDEIRVFFNTCFRSRHGADAMRGPIADALDLPSVSSLQTDRTSPGPDVSKVIKRFGQPICKSASTWA
jgi:hypothetical protein